MKTRNSKSQDDGLLSVFFFFAAYEGGPDASGGSALGV